MNLRLTSPGCLLSAPLLASIVAGLGVLAVLPGSMKADDTVALSQPEETDEGQATADEAGAQKLVDELQHLVLSQQREIARQIIREYPETETARIARDLLDDLELYDEAEEVEYQRELVRTEWIRNFWDARRPPAPVLPNVDITIANLADEAAIFQVRGPSMDWSRPVILPVGDTDRLKYPAAFRRMTKDGTVLYSLQLGGHYVFLKAEGESEPRLYRLED